MKTERKSLIATFMAATDGRPQIRHERPRHSRVRLRDAEETTRPCPITGVLCPLYQAECEGRQHCWVKD